MITYTKKNYKNHYYFFKNPMYQYIIIYISYISHLLHRDTLSVSSKICFQSCLYVI